MPIYFTKDSKNILTYYLTVTATKVIDYGKPMIKINNHLSLKCYFFPNLT